MSRVDDLAPEQRAVLQLLLKQGKGYDELATLLRIPPEAVRERAVAALEALGPRDGVQPPPERREEIADFLLGQAPASRRQATREFLEGSASGRAWARVVAGELRPLAGDELPALPAGAAERPAEEAPARPPARGAPARAEGIAAEAASPGAQAQAQDAVAEAPSPGAQAQDAVAEAPPSPGAQAQAQESPARAAAGAAAQGGLASAGGATTEPASSQTEQAPSHGAESAPGAPWASGPLPTSEARPRPSAAAGSGGSGLRPLGAGARASRTGGLLLLAALAILLVAAVLLIAHFARGGGGDQSGGAGNQQTLATNPPTQPRTGTSAQPQVVAQVNLLPPGGLRGRRLGVAYVITQQGQFGLAVSAQGLAASTPRSVYAAWLADGPGGNRFLGYTPAVGADGRLTFQSGVQIDPTAYRRLLLTREAVSGASTPRPTRPGQVVLAGAIPRPRR